MLSTREEKWEFKVKVSTYSLPYAFLFKVWSFLVVIAAPLDAKFSSLFQDKLVKGKKTC